MKLEGLRPTSRAKRSAARLVILYVVISLIWIFGSDALVESLHVSGSMHRVLQSTKGTVFVLAVGLLLHIGTRKLIDNVDQATRASGEAKLELVHRLALAAEYRDDVTGGHNYRIGCYAEIIAQQMGHPRAFCELIFHAAALHDIGKIAVPDSVLLKRGPLTKRERQVMQRHVELGADLLADGQHDLIRMAHNIALTHHERWDGNGYPQGLREYDIPVEGRIVAVCDVFDALTSARPYKDAWSLEEAADEIRSLSGAAFCPAVVDAFERAFDKLSELRTGDPDRRWVHFRTDMQPSPILAVEEWVQEEG